MSAILVSDVNRVCEHHRLFPAGSFLARSFWRCASGRSMRTGNWSWTKGGSVVMPPPSPLHGGIVWAIGALFAEYSRRMGKGVVKCNDPGIAAGSAIRTRCGPRIWHITARMCG
jgi:hypothetical protein